MPKLLIIIRFPTVSVQFKEPKGKRARDPWPGIPARLKVNGASVKKTSIVGVKKSQLWPVAT
jgi:hypothetical protein